MSGNLDQYLALPYRVIVEPAEDGEGYEAVIPDLKGCVAWGASVQEAYDLVQELKTSWLEIAIEKGWRIPVPVEPSKKHYSGMFRVRLPKYLHRDLAELAEQQDTSLNQLVVSLLSEGVQRLRVLRSGTWFRGISRVVLQTTGETRSYSSADESGSELMSLFDSTIITRLPLCEEVAD